MDTAAAGMPVPDAGAFGFGTPFEEQLAFFRRKLNLPSERWDDIRKSAHDRAFIVAGAAKADLVQDLRSAVDQAMAAGVGVADFKRDFLAVAARNGWTGWRGEGSAAGQAWRARIIYQTNMASSYAAGRWQQLTDPEVTAERPFWRYVHADGVLHPRPAHLAWDGTVLPHDHPFWKTHFAPNGWGCRCEVQPVKAPRPGDKTEPPAGWDSTDPKTGAPPGIDAGFDYAPGAQAAAPLQQLVDRKLLALDAPIGAAMAQALQPALVMERQAAWWETLDEWVADPKPRGRSAVVGALDPRVVSWLEQHSGARPGTAEVAVTDALVLGSKQRRHLFKAQDGLLLEDWRTLVTLLDEPGAVYWDKPNDTLIFVSDGAGPTKAAVEWRPKKKTKTGLNEIVTAFRVNAVDVAAMAAGGQWEIIPARGRRRAGIEPA